MAGGPRDDRSDLTRAVTSTHHPAVTPGAGSKAALVSAARLILINTGIEMTGRRLHRLVQTYQEVVRHNGHGFFGYFTNAILLDADARRRLLADPAIARAISYADPTGELAVAHVLNERKRS